MFRTACCIIGLASLSACARPEVAALDNVPVSIAPPPITVVPPPPRRPDVTELAGWEPLPADAGGFAKCASCHSIKPGRSGIGPSLAGIYGKPAARDPNYRYSDALRNADLVWDAATLDRFLTRPRDLVPGNRMTFAGLSDPAQRAQIIAFIERY